MDTVPFDAQLLTTTFLVAVGADPKYLYLYGSSLWEQQSLWVLESLTTDYLRGRYFLWARSAVFKRMYDFGYPYWGLDKTYDSGWNAERLNDYIMTKDTFQIYLANRGWLYSARAGNPAIIERLRSYIDRPNEYRVYGQHAYYDPVAKTLGRLQDTSATSCNAGNLGLGILDR
ncbi:MAG: hypothetical protein V4695_10745 [Pseudomonadota bacterium]